MDLQLGAVRERIAANPPAGVVGIARPPGLVGAFPCYIVGDPDSIIYQSSYGGRPLITFGVRVIVGRQASQDGTAELDALVSTLPGHLAAIDAGGLWSELNVTELSGGYFDWTQAGKVVGLAADLTVEVIKRNEA